MNLYFLLAIALGAMTGAADVAAARPAFVLAQGEGRQRRHAAESRFARRAMTMMARPARVARWSAPYVELRAEAPLAGAATPRAPSANC